MRMLQTREENYKICNLLASVKASERHALLEYLREEGPVKFIETYSRIIFG